MLEQNTLILASGSRSRADMLCAAGVQLDVVPASVDEATVKEALIAEGHGAVAVADALAELKAVKISGKHPEKLVLGADQTLECDGRLFDKPRSMDEAREHLREFSAKRHKLVSAAVICEGGRPVFRVQKPVTLHVRPLSEQFIDAYLQSAPQDILQSVGAYHLEGLGAQLFHRIDGDYFTVLGLPLLDILGYLRERGYLIS